MVAKGEVTPTSRPVTDPNNPLPATATSAIPSAAAPSPGPAPSAPSGVPTWTPTTGSTAAPAGNATVYWYQDDRGRVYDQTQLTEEQAYAKFLAMTPEEKKLLAQSLSQPD
jgi:hypothetical protein